MAPVTSEKTIDDDLRLNSANAGGNFGFNFNNNNFVHIILSTHNTFFQHLLTFPLSLHQFEILGATIVILYSTEYEITLIG